MGVGQRKVKAKEEKEASAITADKQDIYRGIVHRGKEEDRNGKERVRTTHG